ncbi:enoyl-CoA hydratase/isomerase family protein [Janibacter limosus]|jgi:enoyl-CoA hydratase/carnithine racemase|uniref:Enoyl-CoA hydratase n=1 Tax=Janibacter limosus TaxID=53458 RepID=A0A4P6MYQ0_9MICO|nr:enoyl-CoA hydratase-related protein [Janibacter limosus]QBF47115.1 enoyl-CoA hydratase [Janibacter limosus]
MSDDLVYDVSEHIATITLNRPERKNAFTLTMVDEWTDALRESGADDRVRAVVVTGAGDSFCSGVDLSALAEVEATPLGRKEMLTGRVHRVATALADLDKPVIACMRGAAVGAGMDMGLLCDMRVAGRSIKLIEGYIKVGLVPGDGGAWLLPRLVGTAKAMELLLTGDAVGADEALRLGLVNQVHDDEVVLERTYDLAEKIAAAPPVQVAMIKRLVRSAESVDLRTHYDMVSSHFGVVTAMEDYTEAVAAFGERREGVYQGR